MSRLMCTFLLLILCLAISGCGGGKGIKNSNETGPKTGDKYYIIENYEKVLDSLELTEIVAKPNFNSPFITIVKDKDNKQFAAIFRADGQYELIELPVDYQQILKLIKEMVHPSPTELFEKNVHIFEINNHLYWNHENTYFDLHGKKVDPFKK